VDLFLIPNMVDDYNTKLKAKLYLPMVCLSQPVYNEFVAVNIATTEVLPSREQLMVLQSRCCAERTSVTQGYDGYRSQLCGGIL